MKGQFAAISYSLYVELKYLMIRFWTILLAFVVVDILVFRQVNEHLLLVTSMPQYIFSGIVSFIIIRKSFSFCLKLGATRKAYLSTMTCVFALFAIVMSLINVVIMSVSTKVINSLNLMNIQLYYASDFIFHDPTVAIHFLTDAVFYLFYYSSIVFARQHRLQIRANRRDDHRCCSDFTVHDSSDKRTGYSFYKRLCERVVIAYIWNNGYLKLPTLSYQLAVFKKSVSCPSSLIKKQSFLY
ncbi:hypothetical protein M3225_01965 [Priestia aryabhattai]|uniref:hypothetical protein n=1 Tax=Priestia aryabhattai TaxID=412384 RepID=UPI00203AF6E5|nr:hypothetical protein [Priestia aryabhattai]MCM3769247.1 hypothetical protein [Priestia aryabhattai]